MNPDFVDLLRAINAANVRFLVVGAYALALHGRPRATGDLDFWIDATADNAARVMEALAAFGAPLAEVSAGDFARAGVVYQIGVPPGRIDILTELTGLAFDDAWPDRLRRPFGSIEVDFTRRGPFPRFDQREGLQDIADVGHRDLGDVASGKMHDHGRVGRLQVEISRQQKGAS